MFNLGGICTPAVGEDVPAYILQNVLCLHVTHTHTYTYIYIYNRKDPSLTLTGGAVRVRARQLLPAAGAGALRHGEPSIGLPGAAQEALGPLVHGLSSCSPGLEAAAGMPGVSLRAAVCLSRLHCLHARSSHQTQK